MNPEMLADVNGVFRDATGPVLRADARQRRPPLAHDHLPQRQGGRAAQELFLREHRRRRHLRRLAVLPHPAAPASAGKTGGHRKSGELVKVADNWSQILTCGNI